MQVSIFVCYTGWIYLNQFLQASLLLQKKLADELKFKLNC